MRNIREAATAAVIIGSLSFTGCRAADATPTPTPEPTRGRPPATEPRPLFESPTPTPTELPQSANIQIVEQALQALNIPKNQDEIRLWERKRSIWQEVPGSPQVEKPIANLRIAAVISGMRESKNQKFGNAIKYLGVVSLLDNLVVNVEDHLVGSLPLQQEESNAWRIGTAVSINAVLYKASKEELIIALVEQAELHRNLLELMMLFPSLPPQEQFQQAIRLANTPGKRGEIGARQYAAGIEAYLVQNALMGQSPTDTDAAYLKHVAAYVRYGRNSENLDWRAYVEKYILPPLPST